MTYFKANALVDTLNMLDDLLNSKKLGMLLGLSNFLIVHVNKIVVKKIQSTARKKYNINLYPLIIKIMSRQLHDRFQVST